MTSLKLFITQLFVVSLLLIPAIAVAEEEGLKEFRNNREVINLGLYPPGVIMRMQQRIELTDTQRKNIAGLVRDFQNKVTELQWEMPHEQQKLKQLLAGPGIDQGAAVDQARTVLEMESTFKIANVELLIAIKNELNSDQIKKLDTMIKRFRERQRS